MKSERKEQESEGEGEEARRRKKKKKKVDSNNFSFFSFFFMRMLPLSLSLSLSLSLLGRRMKPLVVMSAAPNGVRYYAGKENKFEAPRPIALGDAKEQKEFEDLIVQAASTSPRTSPLLCSFIFGVARLRGRRRWTR